MTPQWTTRTDVELASGDYGPLLGLVAVSYHVYSKAEEFLGPFNAKQRGHGIYTPPTRDQLRAAIPQYRMNPVSHSAFLSSLIAFCERTKGMQALPTPHPSIIHSIQLQPSTFEIKCQDGKVDLFLAGMDEPLKLKFANAKTAEATKFIILRPKISTVGTASATRWEVLLFDKAYGYIPNWVDANLNPRWSGVM